MKKLIKSLYNNINLVFIVFLIAQPILDVFTAIMLNIFKIDFTVGVVVRFLFLIYLLIYLIFISKSKYKKISLIYISIIFVYMLLFSLNMFFVSSNIAFEIKNLIKYFYFPVMLIIIFNLYSSKEINIDIKLLTYVLIIYLLGVFIPDIFSFGFKSYAVTKKGSTGLFYTANEISAIISILMPLFIYYFYKKKNTYLTIISFFLLFYVITSLGTKGPLLSLFIIIIFFIIKMFITFIHRKEWKKVNSLIISFIVFILALVFILPKTVFYKNIVTHLRFLKVDSVSEVVSNEKVFDHLVFSQRLSFWFDTSKVYKNSNLSSKVVGIGYLSSKKMVEMDYVDIFYRCGVLGFVIYMIPIIYILLIIFKNINKNTFKLLINNFYLLSIILSIVLAFMTGHVFVAPSVCIYVVLIFNMFYNELGKGDKIEKNSISNN